MPKIDVIPDQDPITLIMNNPAKLVGQISKANAPAGTTLNSGRPATHRYQLSVRVDAANSDWQGSPVVLAAGETVEITASGTWYVIGTNQAYGPAGHYGVPAYGQTTDRWGITRGGYLKPGAFEGCLLVQDGTGHVQEFRRDDDTITVHAPGRISFIANDEPNPDKGVKHNGYDDNSGFLTVTLTWHD